MTDAPAAATKWAPAEKVVLGCIAFVVWWTLAVFPAVPFLPIGRTAGSLLGAMLMVLFQVISPNAAFAAIDLPILALLFGTMVISVYLERANLFRYLGQLLRWKSHGAKDFLCRVCVLSAVCSALFTNDTTCVVLTGFVLKLCEEQKLPVLPFLMALATSANIGSAGTAIGNPQNLVIAVKSGISFGKFLAGIIPAVVVGIVVNTILLLVFYWRLLSTNFGTDGRGAVEDDRDKVPQTISVASAEIPLEETNDIEEIPLEETNGIEDGETRSKETVNDLEQYAAIVLHSQHEDSKRTSTSVHVGREDTLLSIQGSGDMAGASRIMLSGNLRRRLWVACVYFITIGFLAALLAGLNLSWSALTAAVVLTVLDFTDAGASLDKVSYSLLVFFSGMFIAVEGFNLTGAPGEFWNAVERHAHIDNAKGLTVLSLVIILLSNVASNVPTVLLLGARVAASAALTPGANVTRAWLILAWVSTVAGNLTLLGSAANLIVSEQARTSELQFNFTFRKHLPFGVLSTLIIVAVGVPLIQGR